MKNLYSIFIFILFLALESFGQPEIDIPILVHDNAGEYRTIYFGLDYFATDGIDSQLGEYDISSLPPNLLDARWFLPPFDGSVSSFRDYRTPAPSFYPFTGNKSHVIHFQTTNYPVTFSWSLPWEIAPSSTIQYYIGGQLHTVSFSQSGSLTITDSTVTQLYISVDYLDIFPSDIPPAFRIFPYSLNFDSVAIGTFSTLQSTVVNLAQVQELIIYDITSSNEQFTFTPNSFPITVPVGGMLEIDITFTPTMPGMQTADLMFLYNLGPIQTIDPLHGIGIPTTQTTFQLSVDINNGWNMVSVPGINPNGQGVSTWWSGRNMLADVYKWNTGYVSVTSTTPTEGYWMLHTGAKTYNTGDEWPAGGIIKVPHDSIYCNGWSIIGVYECPVIVSGITTNPPGIIQSSCFGYLDGYQIVDTLYPGYGYWILLSTPGWLIFPPCDTNIASSKVAEFKNKELGKIIITDIVGRHYTLYTVNGEVNLDHYQLPPLPPAGMFDIRYSSNRKAEDLKKGNQTIEMRGIEYPVRIKVENVSIRIQDETGKIVNARMKSGEELIINNSSVSKLNVSADLISVEYALEQNYPNPFNPSTKIKYTIPKVETHRDASLQMVTLKVYDVLGKEVATLVNEEKQPGVYEVEFDGSGLASNIYIYRLTAADFSAVKKLVLIK